MTLKIASLVLFFLFFTTHGHAFPELVRMGYQNCMACHVSPTGGGVLTPYGRGMASEVLSTWHYEGEEAIGHGLIKGEDGKAWASPEWLQLGGDSRWIQSYVNNVTATQTQFFPMENQLEAAVHVAGLWLVGNLDFVGGPPGTPNYGSLISERLYAMYNLTDELYVRAGKYEIPIGINQPDHSSTIRRGLGWDALTETDNVEAGYIGDKWNLIATGNFGRPDNSDINNSYEKGFIVNGAYNLLTSHKLGWTFYDGNATDSTRYFTGPFVILGFWKKLTLLSQFDWQWKDFNNNAVSEQKGFVTYNRLQYEVVKGLHPYVVEQINYLDTSTGNRLDSIGGGIIWYPRPHFEFWGEWDRVRNTQVAADYGDSAWLVLHYYL